MPRLQRSTSFKRPSNKPAIATGTVKKDEPPRMLKRTHSFKRSSNLKTKLKDQSRNEVDDKDDSGVVLPMLKRATSFKLKKVLSMDTTEPPSNPKAGLKKSTSTPKLKRSTSFSRWAKGTAPSA